MNGQTKEPAPRDGFEAQLQALPAPQRERARRALRRWLEAGLDEESARYAALREAYDPETD